MRSSVPGKAALRRVVVAKEGRLGKSLALERRRREWAQLGEKRGTRTGACTDISRTSLHNQKERGSQCTSEIPLNARSSVVVGSLDMPYAGRSRLSGAHPHVGARPQSLTTFRRSHTIEQMSWAVEYLFAVTVRSIHAVETGARGIRLK